METAAESKLESWKAIANHLNRSVRTVRRWEQTEGLPVHRHLHGGGATIYAFRNELDRWAEERAETPSALDGTGKWIVQSAAAVLLALVIAVVVAYWPETEQDTSAPSPGNQPWILVTGYQNHSGNQALSGALEHLLASALSNGGHRVVPRPRVNDVLQLMGRELDTTIDLALGLEIAIRDGGIGLVVAGQIDQVGDDLVVSSTLTNPADIEQTRTLEPWTLDDDTLVASIAEYGHRVAEAAHGLSASPRPLTPFEFKVSTESLEALKLFARADSLIPIDRRDEAAGILKQALALDPDFAAAHLWLSYVAPPEERDFHRRRAFELADTVSERERLFIIATWQWNQDQHDAAIETFYRLVRTYPDHFYGTINLIKLLMHARRTEEVVAQSLRFADMQPNAPYAQPIAARGLYNIGKPEEGLRLVERILAFPDDLAQAYAGTLWAGTVLLPAVHAWTQRDEGAAVAWVERVLNESSNRKPLLRSRLKHNAAVFFLGLGEIERAEQLLVSIKSTTPPVDIPDRQTWYTVVGSGTVPDPVQNMAWIHLERGDREAFRETLRQSGPLRGIFPEFLGWAGLSEWLEPLIENSFDSGWPKHTDDRATIHLARGGVALYEKGPEAALNHFEAALEVVGDYELMMATKLRALEWKARALLALRRVEEAIDVLAQAESLRRPGAPFDHLAVYAWKRCMDLKQSIDLKAENG